MTLPEFVKNPNSHFFCLSAPKVPYLILTVKGRIVLDQVTLQTQVQRAIETKAVIVERRTFVKCWY